MVVSLAIVSPVPPQRNGIADYTYELAKVLQRYYEFDIIVDRLPGRVPDGVGLIEAKQAFRCLPTDVILYQIGNNQDHAYIIPMLRRWGGIVTLHDLNLYHLYETMGATVGEFARGMQAVSPALAAQYAPDLECDALKPVRNYTLFDMLFEVVQYSTLLIVHSQFAKARLEAIYGDRIQGRIRVIPHLALSSCDMPSESLRRDCGVGPDELLVVTAGFTGKAKRFDWIVKALDRLAGRGVALRWIHAGEDRPEDMALIDMIQARPHLRNCSSVTGYLRESELNSHIQACDIFISLRSPSLGEASGTLSRAMSAGRCCLVSDTCAYSELPRDAVVHVSASGGAVSLFEALLPLAEDPARRQRIGHAARQFSQTAWDPAMIADMYADVITEAAVLPSRRRGSLKQDAAETRASELLVIDYDDDRELSSRLAVAFESSTSHDMLIRFASLSHMASAVPDMTGLFANALPVRSQIKSCRVVSGRFLRDGQGADRAGSCYELGLHAGVYLALDD